MRFELPRAVKFILDRLTECGHRADVVGGAVRDAYLGRETSDYDITTDALPARIKEVFSGVRTIDTGIKHGTVALHIDGENYEITTYRRDGDYLDARHPSSVEFTESLAEDVKRRDFTMNALCYNEADGITDLVGGIADIDRGLIRTVGDPVTRFSEDALRILRAVRFSSVLGFSIERETASAVVKCAPELKSISGERIYSEWQKLIAGDNAYAVLRDYFSVVRVFLPIERAVLPSPEKFRTASPLARTLSLFALGCDKPDESFDIAMSGLKTDRATRELGRLALACLSRGVPSSVREALATLSEYGEAVTRLAVETAVLTGRAEVGAFTLVEEAIASGVPYSVGALAVGGGDLLQIGLSGAEIGRELKRLLSAVMDGECENTKEALLKFLTKNSI